MSDSQEWFRDVYLQTYTDLVRFAVRRLNHPQRAEDIVAEAFTVAWQRLGDMPRELGEARAWLFGITRRLLLAAHRAENQGQALSVRIAAHATATTRHDDLVVTSVDLLNAWQRLTAVHQEALSLSVWEGLNATQAGQVLGISPVAFRIRLSRARRALQLHLRSQPGDAPSHRSSVSTAEGRQA